MRPDELKYSLPDYIAGKLPEKEAEVLRLRIENDAEFKAEYLRLRATMSVLDKDRSAEVTPPDVFNILVGVNEQLDSAQKSGFWDFLPARVLVPAIAAVVVVVVGIFSLPDSKAPMLSSDTVLEIEQALESANMDDIAQLQTVYQEDIILQDVHIEAAEIPVDADLEDELSQLLEERMFEDLAFEDVLGASDDYLTDDELYASLSTETLDKLLEDAKDKSFM